MGEIGKVSYVLMTLENGERTIRNRALLRGERGKIFIDSILADVVKIYFLEGGRGDISEGDEKFLISINVKDLTKIPDRFLLKAGEVLAEVERFEGFKFKILEILRGGFVKAGNDVYIVKF